VEILLYGKNIIILESKTSKHPLKISQREPNGISEIIKGPEKTEIRYGGLI